MIDFSKINAFDKGQRGSFEDLVCVLAKRMSPSQAFEFQPNDGRGGDGGVEAIWLLNNGKKVGYQAKFFLTIDEPQWRQMDKSVKQAIDVHSNLVNYIIAVPCNLTPDRGEKVTGKSERAKWKERVEKWTGWANEKSVDVNFELWSETDLREMLLRETNAALVKHWFGKVVLKDSWFIKQISVANRILDDRFNPDDHIEVSIESMFDTLVRGPGVTDRLSSTFDELEALTLPSTELSLAEGCSDPTDLLAATNAWREMVDLRRSFPHDFNKKWDVNRALSVLENLRGAVWSLLRSLGPEDSSPSTREDDHKLKVVRRRLRDLSSFCYSAIELFKSPSFESEASQWALVYGPAGAGKSHLLGQVATEFSQARIPVVLVLGQSFSGAFFWDQLGTMLGLDGRTKEDILGVLDAAGARRGERTVLLFDAINEGVGAKYWRGILLEVVQAIQEFPNLAAVFSCREEYVSYALPNSLSGSLSKFRIVGFTTPAELELAAKQYLDRKGIARPNTPWLSPEFSNPLFLKSTSEALHAKGCNEFPRGLRGVTEVMAHYLDALSWRTGVGSTNPDAISGSIKKCATQMAESMAIDGCDYIEIDKATSIAHRCFQSRTPPEGSTWLQILIDASLFRRDPPPYRDDIDHLAPPPELIRFSFQRFQDYLMAASLVSKVKIEDISSAFDDDGPLNFLFPDGKLIQGFPSKNAGIISALSTIYPEKLGVEFTKTLPDWENQWKKHQVLQISFAESFKWRSTKAFSNDTKELLNLLDAHFERPLGVLLEVSMTIDHPFNSLRLHAHLNSMSMPERDSYWSRWINSGSSEDLSQVERIIAWALSDIHQSTEVKHLELASIVLAWFLSSSHMTLRDRATKALTTLFLAESSVFTFVLEKMHGCDDPYIVERIYAAAFGACCIDPKPERLNTYSSAVFSRVFEGGQQPVALLTRDYALGTIELANTKGALSSGVTIEDCYPPFVSEAPEFGLVKEDVEAIAKKTGGMEIFRSASSEWGDFGKYTIRGRVRSFLTTPLTEEPPISKEESRLAFIEEVISPHTDRVTAMGSFERAMESARGEDLRRFTNRLALEDIEDATDQFEKEQNDARCYLETLLDESERRRLSEEFLWEGRDIADLPSVDVQQCRLWITKRAYQLGWNSELFLNDGYGMGHSRHENDLERIGKKYQRIALDELEARLADNFWTVQDWPKEVRAYRYSDNDFRRNLEPTILPIESSFRFPFAHLGEWACEPNIRLPQVDEEKLKQWPFEKDPAESMANRISRIDENGASWLVLYDFNLDRRTYEEPNPGEHNLRCEEFRFFYCVFVRHGKASELASFLEAGQTLNTHSFQPREFTDGPFLLEAHWRDTWNSEKFSDMLIDALPGCEIAIPVARYVWESHLDKSLPEGFQNYMPHKWFADELGLSVSKNRLNCWQNQEDIVVLQTLEPSANRHVVVINERELFNYCNEFAVQPVWVMIAERNAYPQGSNDEFCGRRSEGVVWMEGESWQHVNWKKDTKR